MKLDFSQLQRRFQLQQLYKVARCAKTMKLKQLDQIEPRGVCQSHCGLAIYIGKYLNTKEEELWKLKYFTMPPYDLQKYPLKRNQNPSRYYNSIITNLKFQHKPKLSCFKNPQIKIDLLLLPRGQNSLSYYTL